MHVLLAAGAWLGIASPLAQAVEAEKRWVQVSADASMLVALDLGNQGSVVGYTMVLANATEHASGKIVSISGKLRFDCAGRRKRDGDPGMMEYLDVVAELTNGAKVAGAEQPSQAVPEYETLACEERNQAAVEATAQPLSLLTSQYASDLRAKGLSWTPRPSATESCAAVKYNDQSLYLIESGPLPIGSKDPRPEFVAYVAKALPRPKGKLGDGGCSPTDPAKNAEFMESLQHTYLRRQGLKLVRMGWKPGDVARPQP